MALSPPLDADPDEVRAVLAPHRNDFTIALYAAENAFAVGAIIRVAHSFLARDIVLIGDAPYYEKASMGMERYETVVRVPDEDALVAHVGARPIWAVEKDHATTSVYAVERFPEGVVLLFGSERFGVPPSMIARADAVLGIPLYGVNHSLPLAVAAGIVMSEWARRRYTPGAIG
ncbi:MAG: TrmH family RNA methyltransferase [Polyangiaceae bacterium]